MATFRKRHNKWQAIVRHKSIGTTSKSFYGKAEAKKWAYETERSIEANTFGKLLPASLTLAELLQRYQENITPLKRGRDAENRRIKRLLKDSISLNPVDRLTSQTLATFRDRRIQAGVRAAQYDLVIIRHCIKIAMNEWGLMIERNPADMVQMPPSPKPRQRRVLTDELERITKAAELTQNTHILPIILFAIETGMRRSEILGLEWNQLYLDRQIVFLPITKNGLSREVPLTQKAKNILVSQSMLDIPSPFPISSNALRMAWDRLLRRANVSGLRFHDLRHEAISRLFEMGLSIPEVALISGHKDPRMLFRYTHMNADKVAIKLNGLQNRT